jgi:hypothetical protein
VTIQELLAELLRAAHAVSSWGSVAALLLMAGGGLLIALGYRTFRPTAAFLAALVAAHGIAMAMNHHELRLQMPVHTAQWMAGVVTFPLALMWPFGATIAAAAGAAFFVGFHITPRNDPDMALFVWTGAVALGAMIPAVMYNFLPAIVVPMVGSALVSLGLWGLVGVHHASLLIYRVPVAWLVLWGVLGFASGALENSRLLRAQMRGSAKASGTAGPAGGKK